MASALGNPIAFQSCAGSATVHRREAALPQDFRFEDDVPQILRFDAEVPNFLRFIESAPYSRRFGAAAPHARLETAVPQAHRFDAVVPHAHRFDTVIPQSHRLETTPHQGRRFETVIPQARRFKVASSQALRFETAVPHVHRFEDVAPQTLRFESAAHQSHRFERAAPQSRRFEDVAHQARRFELVAPQSRRFEAIAPHARRFEAIAPHARRFKDVAPHNTHIKAVGPNSRRVKADVSHLRHKAAVPHNIFKRSNNAGSCCYNGTDYNNGTTVKNFLMSCLQLICVMGNIEPYAPFGRCGRNCCIYNNELHESGSTWIDGCATYRCDDGDVVMGGENPECCNDNGILRPSGSTWTVNCEIFTCNNGDISKTGNDPTCCIVNGELQPNGTTWFDNCYHYTCEEGTIVQTGVDPTCCNVSGELRPNGTTWFDNCYHYTCEEGTIVQTGVDPTCCNVSGILVPNATVSYKDCLRYQCINGHNLQEGFDPSCCFMGTQLVPHDTYLNESCIKMACMSGNWVTDLTTSDNCERCRAYNDPHLTDYLQRSYDFHGKCNYSLSQDGQSYEPEVAVFGSFGPCATGDIPGASCLGVATLREGVNIIKIGYYGLSPPDLYKLDVNGEPYIVPISGISSVTSGGGMQLPFLAWRSTQKLHLQGKTFYITHDEDQMSIYINKEIAPELTCGLCGSLSNQSPGCPPFRPGTGASIFGDSWKNDTEPNECHVTRRRRRQIACEEMADFVKICREAIEPAIEVNVEKYTQELQIRSENCAFDMCVFKLAGDTNYENWKYKCLHMMQSFVDEEEAVTPDNGECPENPSDSVTAVPTILATTTTSSHSN